MTIEVQLTRRAALLGAGGALAGASLAGTLPAHAAADKQGPLNAPVARYSVGEFEVNTLLDGAVNLKEPQKTFGMNVDADTFASASADNFIPADAFRAFFTPTLVNTGNELILFDTGVGEGGRPARGNRRAALESAGYTPEQVDYLESRRREVGEARIEEVQAEWARLFEELAEAFEIDDERAESGAGSAPASGAAGRGSLPGAGARAVAERSSRVRIDHAAIETLAIHVSAKIT